MTSRVPKIVSAAPERTGTDGAVVNTITPMLFPSSVNHRLPSGPVVIHVGALLN